MRELLCVSGITHHVLINQQGQIVNPRAPGPGGDNTESGANTHLVEAIQALLQE